MDTCDCSPDRFPASLGESWTCPGCRRRYQSAATPGYPEVLADALGWRSIDPPSLDSSTYAIWPSSEAI